MTWALGLETSDYSTPSTGVYACARTMDFRKPKGAVCIYATNEYVQCTQVLVLKEQCSRPEDAQKRRIIP